MTYTTLLAASPSKLPSIARPPSRTSDSFSDLLGPKSQEGHHSFSDSLIQRVAAAMDIGLDQPTSTPEDPKESEPQEEEDVVVTVVTD
jgi:hypothetical protein